MGKALRLGPMVLNLKVSMCMEKRMAKANLNGPINRHMKEILLITTYKEWAFTIGQMVECSKVNGTITRCMA